MNNREHPRYAVEVDAQVRLDEKSVGVRTKNVSRGGMCFESAHALPLDRVVALRLALVFDERTLSEPIELSARVVWCTALGKGLYQVGASFVDMTNESRTYLDMFLRYLKEGLDFQAQSEDDGGDDGDVPGLADKGFLA